MTEQQQAALKRVWEMGRHASHGGAIVCAKLLLGIYNGDRFKFDLTELRRLDDQVWRDCIAVLELDAHPRHEVHNWLNLLYGVTDMGDRFELIACDLRMKGKCSKEYEKELRERRAARAGS